MMQFPHDVLQQLQETQERRSISISSNENQSEGRPTVDLEAKRAPRPAAITTRPSPGKYNSSSRRLAETLIRTQRFNSYDHSDPSSPTKTGLSSPGSDPEDLPALETPKADAVRDNPKGHKRSTSVAGPVAPYRQTSPKGTGNMTWRPPRRPPPVSKPVRTSRQSKSPPRASVHPAKSGHSRGPSIGHRDGPPPTPPAPDVRKQIKRLIDTLPDESIVLSLDDCMIDEVFRDSDVSVLAEKLSEFCKLTSEMDSQARAELTSLMVNIICAQKMNKSSAQLPDRQASQGSGFKDLWEPTEQTYKKLRTCQTSLSSTANHLAHTSELKTTLHEVSQKLDCRVSYLQQHTEIREEDLGQLNTMKQETLLSLEMEMELWSAKKLEVGDKIEELRKELERLELQEKTCEENAEKVKADISIYDNVMTQRISSLGTELGRKKTELSSTQILSEYVQESSNLVDDDSKTTEQAEVAQQEYLKTLDQHLQGLANIAKMLQQRIRTSNGVDSGEISEKDEPEVSPASTPGTDTDTGSDEENLAEIRKEVDLIISECWKIVQPHEALQGFMKTLDIETNSVLELETLLAKYQQEGLKRKVTSSMLDSITSSDDTKTMAELLESPVNRANRKSLASVFSEVGERLTSRGRVLREIVESESTYIRRLETIVHTFENPLKELDIVSEDTVKNIFSNIGALLSLHQMMYLEFLKTKNIPQVFLSIGDHLKIYMQYVNGYETCLKTLTDLKKSTDFQKFLRDTKTDMTQFLITPVQRIPRYVLLLTELKKHTEETHPDQQIIEQALNKITSICVHINEAKRRYEHQSVMLAINLQDGDFLQPNRKLILRSELRLRPDKGSPEYCDCMLFSDVYVYRSHKNKFKKNDRFKYLTLSDIFVVEYSEPVRKRYGFNILHPDGPLLFLCKNQEQQREWFDHLATAKRSKELEISKLDSQIQDLQRNIREAALAQDFENCIDLEKKIDDVNQRIERISPMPRISISTPHTTIHLETPAAAKTPEISEAKKFTDFLDVTPPPSPDNRSTTSSVSEISNLPPLESINERDDLPNLNRSTSPSPRHSRRHKQKFNTVPRNKSSTVHRRIKSLGELFNSSRSPPTSPSNRPKSGSDAGLAPTHSSQAGGGRRGLFRHTRDPSGYEPSSAEYQSKAGNVVRRWSRLTHKRTKSAFDGSLPSEPIVPNDTIISGHLLKKGSRGYGSWKKRFVVLTESKLIYYDQVGDKIPKGDISLATLTRIELLKPDKIILYMNEQNRMDFRANDAVTCSEWIKQLRQLSEASKQQQQEQQEQQNAKKRGAEITFFEALNGGE